MHIYYLREFLQSADSTTLSGEFLDLQALFVFGCVWKHWNNAGKTFPLKCEHETEVWKPKTNYRDRISSFAGASTNKNWGDRNISWQLLAFTRFTTLFWRGCFTTIFSNHFDLFFKKYYECKNGGWVEEDLTFEQHIAKQWARKTSVRVLAEIGLVCGQFTG